VIAKYNLQLTILTDISDGIICMGK